MEKKAYSLRTRALYKFLKKHRLFAIYLKNIREQHPVGRGIEEYDKDGDILRLLSINGSIDHSFCWSETPQGHRFWDELDNLETREFKEYLKIKDIMHPKEFRDNSFVKYL